MRRLEGIDKGIVRLFRDGADGREHVGLGVLVDETTVVTCAHVVNDCLRRGPMRESAPEQGARVLTSFPILRDEQVIEARIAGWSPPGLAGIDCAVLELAQPAPAAAGRATLTVLENDDPTTHEMSIYSSFGLQHSGTHLRARFAGPVAASAAQLIADGGQVFQPGFSGGGVWDNTEKTCVGIFVAVKTDAGGTIGYFVDAQRISDEFGDRVPFEYRRMSQGLQRIFTCLAAFIFLWTLVRLLGLSESFVDNLPLAMGDTKLAAYYGVHVFAVLGPVLMRICWVHARSFSRSAARQRVPAFLAKRPGESIANTQVGAALVFVFLLLFPCLAQGRMMDEAFFQEPRIYVQKKAFPEADAAFFDCDVDGGASCLSPDAGLWSIVGWSPYLDNIYQYGGKRTCGDSRCAVTFFPILQPAVLMGGTLLAYGFFLMFVFALLRPWPFRPRARRFPGE